MNKYYWNYERIKHVSLKDMLVSYIGLNDNPYAHKFWDVFYDNAVMYTDLYDLRQISTLWNSAKTGSAPYLEDLWRYVLTSYYEWFVGYSSLNDADLKEVFQRFIRHFINKIMLTYDRYTVLLDGFSKMKTDILNEVESSLESKTSFSDTPQSSGSFETDTHRSSFSKVETKSVDPRGTPMERFAEVESKLSNIYKSWLKEFKEMFYTI